MPLYIKDQGVDDLAEEVQKITGHKNKTEAVRAALLNEIQRARASLSLDDKLEQAMAIADSIGPTRPDYDYRTSQFTFGRR